MGVSFKSLLCQTDVVLTCTVFFCCDVGVVLNDAEGEAVVVQGSVVFIPAVASSFWLIELMLSTLWL